MLKTINTPSKDQVKTSARSSATKDLPRTIFHEDWWLRITSDDSYRESIVTLGGHIVGRLPYRLSKAFGGFTIVDMPRLVHALGPLVAPQFTRDNFPRSLKEFSILSDLISQLPKASHISFRLHSGITNTLAFEAAGFSCSPSFTVEIPPLPAEMQWMQLRDKTRNIVRRASECLEVTSITDVELFVDFYEQNLQRKGRKNEYERHICTQLIHECLKRRVGTIWAARDASGALQAAIFTVWDAATEYYFMATRTLTSVNGANSLLIWEAIKHASANQLTFDMDGLHVVSGGVPNLILLTGFGGKLQPRYQVQKSSCLLSVGRFLRGLRKD